MRRSYLRYLPIRAPVQTGPQITGSRSRSGRRLTATVSGQRLFIQYVKILLISVQIIAKSLLLVYNVMVKDSQR